MQNIATLLRDVLANPIRALSAGAMMALAVTMTPNPAAFAVICTAGLLAGTLSRKRFAA